MTICIALCSSAWTSTAALVTLPFTFLFPSSILSGLTPTSFFLFCKDYGVFEGLEVSDGSGGLRTREDEEKASRRQTNDVISLVRVWTLGQVGHGTNSCQGRDRQTISDKDLVERCGLGQSDEVSCGRL